MSKYIWLLFVLGAVLSWGAYVVTIDQGRTKLAYPLPKNFWGGATAGMRAFLFIGLAYFVMGVIVPGIFLYMNRDKVPASAGFTMNGSILSLIAGALGAAGALCIVFAVGYGRQSMGGVASLIVPALVFSFAPIVNCLITMVIEPPSRINPMFFIGLLLAAAGAFLALYFKPAAAPHATPAAAPTAQIAPHAPSNI